MQSITIIKEIVLLFVWCLTTHQPLWVISVRRYKVNMMGMEKVKICKNKMKDDDEFV